MWHLLLVYIRNYTRDWTLHAARVMHFSVHHEDIRRQKAKKVGTLGDENSEVGMSLDKWHAAIQWQTSKSMACDSLQEFPVKWCIAQRYENTSTKIQNS